MNAAVRGALLNDPLDGVVEIIVSDFAMRYPNYGTCDLPLYFSPRISCLFQNVFRSLLCPEQENIKRKAKNDRHHMEPVYEVEWSNIFEYNSPSPPRSADRVAVVTKGPCFEGLR